MYLPLLKVVDTPLHIHRDSVYMVSAAQGLTRRISLEYERVHLPLPKVADTPFHNKENYKG